MADFNSSLPVRTQNNGDIVAFLADHTTSSILNTIKASSTAAVAADTALVVALSPNSPLPAGSANIGSVNQGTSPWIVQDLADGSVAGGTAGTYSQLAGGVYNTTLPTLTNGQQAALQLDSSGRLIVDISTSSTISVTQGTTPWIVAGNLTNNNAAPSTANVGALVALAESTINASRYTSGDQVLLVTDLAGNTNVDIQYYLGAAVSKTNPIATTIADGTNVLTAALSAYGTAPTGTFVMGVNAYITNTPTVNQGTSPWIVKDLADGSVSGGTAGTFSLLAGAIYNSTAPTLTNGQQASLQLDSSGNLKVNLETSIPAGTNLIGGTTVYVGSSAASTSNPLPVTITDSVPGTPIQNYQTSVALAAGASVTLTYTVAASHTFTLQRIWASASGKIKVLAQNNGSTFMVGFNSTANPNIDFTLMTPPTIAAGNTVTVTFTNNDLLAFDVYVTIEGNQN